MPDFLKPPKPLSGMGVTFSSMFAPTVTEQYPEEKKPTAPRYHGRHQLNRHPDGLEKCVGCELCAWACPADAIFVEGADNTDEQRYSPGERYGRVYQINYLRCIGCGLCIEACPTRTDDDQRLRARRRQPRRPHLREAAVARAITGGHRADTARCQRCGRSRDRTTRGRLLPGRVGPTVP